MHFRKKVLQILAPWKVLREFEDQVTKAASSGFMVTSLV
jgi:hypothetical protein